MYTYIQRLYSMVAVILLTTTPILLMQSTVLEFFGPVAKGLGALVVT